MKEGAETSSLIDASGALILRVDEQTKDRNGKGQECCFNNQMVEDLGGVAPFWRAIRLAPIRFSNSNSWDQRQSRSFI